LDFRKQDEKEGLSYRFQPNDATGIRKENPNPEKCDRREGREQPRVFIFFLQSKGVHNQPAKKKKNRKDPSSKKND